MRHWLMKSEPDAYSIDDLARDGVEPWTGIRNYQARNLMRDEMSVGDRVLFYHSNAKPPGVVGIAEIASAAYPDPTQFEPDSTYFDGASSPDDPRWLLVDVRYVAHVDRTVGLPEIKADPALADMVLVKRSRLSVQPVTADEFDHIVALGSSVA